MIFINFFKASVPLQDQSSLHFLMTDVYLSPTRHVSGGSGAAAPHRPESGAQAERAASACRSHGDHDPSAHARGAHGQTPHSAAVPILIQKRREVFVNHDVIHYGPSF